MERREFLESSALRLGGLAMASAMVGRSSSRGRRRIDADQRPPRAPPRQREPRRRQRPSRSVRKWDPAKAEAYLKVNTNPWTNGVLDIKTIELMCVGLNAACTNLQPEPTRRHIRAALQAGATRNEILLVIEGAAFMAIHTCSLGAPMLIEEGKAAGKTVTAKKAATPASRPDEGEGTLEYGVGSVLRP